MIPASRASFTLSMFGCFAVAITRGADGPSAIPRSKVKRRMIGHTVRLCEPTNYPRTTRALCRRQRATLPGALSRSPTLCPLVVGRHTAISPKPPVHRPAVSPRHCRRSRQSQPLTPTSSPKYGDGSCRGTGSAWTTADSSRGRPGRRRPIARRSPTRCTLPRGVGSGRTMRLRPVRGFYWQRNCADYEPGTVRHPDDDEWLTRFCGILPAVDAPRMWNGSHPDYTVMPDRCALDQVASCRSVFAFWARPCVAGASPCYRQIR
jgi:hypothetical protein